MTGTDLYVSKGSTSRSYLDHLVHPASVICVSVCLNEEVVAQFLNYFSFDVVISFDKGKSSYSVRV